MGCCLQKPVFGNCPSMSSLWPPCIYVCFLYRLTSPFLSCRHVLVTPLSPPAPLCPPVPLFPCPPCPPCPLVPLVPLSPLSPCPLVPLVPLSPLSPLSFSPPCPSSLCSFLSVPLLPLSLCSFLSVPLAPIVPLSSWLLPVLLSPLVSLIPLFPLCPLSLSVSFSPCPSGLFVPCPLAPFLFIPLFSLFSLGALCSALLVFFVIPVDFMPLCIPCPRVQVSHVL